MDIKELKVIKVLDSLRDDALLLVMRHEAEEKVFEGEVKNFLIVHSNLLHSKIKHIGLGYKEDSLAHVIVI